MKTPTGEEHFRKYAALVKLHGLKIDGDKFMGLNPHQMRAKIRRDPALNNVRTLQAWDAASFHLIGKRQPFDNSGDYRPVPKYGPCQTITQSEAVCCVKHLAKFQFAECEPVFVPFNDPSRTDPYPRLPEWD
jgi:hypothetical protein